MSINWSYTLVGFLVGTCMAYSGVGAGAITTPLLIFLGVGSNTAIGSDLLFALGTKIVAMATHMQRRTVQFSVLWRLSLGGLPGAIIGVTIAAYMKRHLDVNELNEILKFAVAIALMLSAAGIIVNRTLSPDAAATGVAPTLQLAVVGFFIGICVSITSIGAGSLTLPLLLIAAPSVALRRLVGTDLAFAVVILVPSLIGHWKIGDVNTGIAISLLIGSIPGIFLGTHFVARLPERWFRSALAGVLVAVALALLPILPHAKS